MTVSYQIQTITLHKDRNHTKLPSDIEGFHNQHRKWYSKGLIDELELAEERII